MTKLPLREKKLGRSDLGILLGMKKDEIIIKKISYAYRRNKYFHLYLGYALDYLCFFITWNFPRGKRYLPLREKVVGLGSTWITSVIWGKLYLLSKSSWIFFFQSGSEKSSSGLVATALITSLRISDFTLFWNIPIFRLLKLHNRTFSLQFLWFCQAV